MKRVIPWLLGALTVLGIVVAAVFVTLSQATLTTELAHAVVGRLQKQLPAAIAFGHLSVNAGKGEIAIDELAVTVPGHPHEKLLAARQAIATLSLPELLRGRVVIKRLHLVNPDITIIHRGGDRYNFQEIIPTTPEDKSKSKQTFFALERVTFDGGHLSYLDPPRKIQADAPHLKGSLALDINEPMVKGRVAFSNGWARVAGIKEPLDSFFTDINLHGNAMTLDRFRLDVGKSNLAMSGRLDRLGEKDASLALDGLLNGPLKQWSALAKTPLVGTLKTHFDLTGLMSAPTVAATVEGHDLGARALRIPLLEARLKADDKQLSLLSLDAKLWGGRLSAQGHAPLKAGAGNFQLAARASQLDLQSAARELQLKDMHMLSGRLSANIQARGPRLDARAIEASGWVNAQGRVPTDPRHTLAVAAFSHLHFQKGLLELSGVNVNALGGRLTGQGQVTPLARVPRYAFDGQLSGLKLADIQPLLDSPLPVGGTVSGAIHMAGRSFQKPELTAQALLHAQVVLKKGQANNALPLPVNATAALHLSNQLLSIQNLLAQTLGGTVTGRGSLDLRVLKPVPVLNLKARGLDLQALNRTFKLANATLKGRLDASIAYAHDALTIDSAKALTLGGSVEAHGRIGLTGVEPRYALGVIASHLDLAQANSTFHLTPRPVKGQASARMAIQGVGARFLATGPIKAQGSLEVPSRLAGATREILPFVLQAQASVGPRAVGFQPLTLRVGSSSLSARGRLALDSASDLAFRGTVTDTPAIAEVLGLGSLTGGTLHLQGRAQGAPRHLNFSMFATMDATRLNAGLAFKAGQLHLLGTLSQSLSARGTLESSQMVIQGQPFTRLSIPFSYQAEASALGRGQLSLPAILVQLPKGDLRGNASVDLASKDYQVALTSKGLDLGSFKALQAQAAKGVPLQTPLLLSLKGQGRLDDPEVLAQVNVGAFRYKGQAFAPSVLKGQLHAGQLLLHAGMFGRELLAEGHVALKGDSEGNLTLTLLNAQLAPVFALLPVETSKIVEVPRNGVLSGTLSLDGPFKRPAQLSASVNLGQLSITYPDFTLANDGPLRLSYKARQVQLDQVHLIGKQTDIQARGNVGLGAPSNLAINGRLNMAFLAKLSPQNFADSAGQAVIEAQLNGTLGAPDLKGALSIQDGELSTRNLPQALHALNASLRIDNGRLFLDNLQATLGYTGRIQAFGGAILGKNFMPQDLSLQLTARDVAARVTDISTLLNADLAFSGNPDDSRLTGQVKVLEGHVTQNVDLTGGLGSSQNAAPPADFSKIPFLRHLALQVQINSPGQLFVKNNVANAELRGDLLLLGTPSYPALVGHVETVSGTATFQGHDYQLTDAAVDFTDANRISPYLHVDAQTSIQSYDVRLQVNGSPEALKLDLTSTPMLPQSDILTLIATGQTPAQLQQGSGNLSSAAGNLLVDQLTQNVAQNLTGQGVVDVLRIQPGTTNSTQATVGGFTVGKRLSEKLMVTYTQDLTNTPGQPTGNLVTFQYQLTPTVVLQLEQRLEGGFNATARYQFNLR